MVADITQAKKDVVVNAGTSTGKSLPYQSIPIITREIVLVVLPTIVLMEDQVGCLLIPVSHVSFAKLVAKRDYLLGLNITAVAFTITTIERNPQVWKRVDRSNYSVVFALPKILLGVQSHFWLQTVRVQDHGFCRQLVCIVVDEVHLVWG